MVLYDKDRNLLEVSKFYDSDVAGNRKQEIKDGKKNIKSLFYENGDDTLLKVFTYNKVGDKIIGEHYITKKDFDILKSINNPNIVKLLDYYSYEYNIKEKRMDAYTMKKVHSKKIDLLSEEKAILLYYLADLQKLALDLTKEGFRMEDYDNGANLLFDSKGPVVVDVDYYSTKNNPFSKTALEVHNKGAALIYLKSYAQNNFNFLYEHEDQDEYIRKTNDFNGIFAIGRINKDTDIVKELDNNISDNSIAHQLKLKRTKF